ncbi:hypothetical protein BHM03_00058064 [Ensete ventricosum]|uniref:Uncharacterized protein n=1 Tax=Ensete ventricosum TaxID=4639 RepID=A0A445MMH3_ENSVE|nr:hypothetical protein BHM03_00058064 [Ensete ventricosum]
MHRVDVVGNSPGVCRKLTEGIGSLLGWRKGVHQKKIKTRQKIIGDSQKAYRDLGIKPGSDDAVRSHRKFARRFAEGIEKLAGNVKGDCQEEDRRTCRKVTGVNCSYLIFLGMLDFGSGFDANLRPNYTRSTIV